jgi:hypothetical protein
MEQGEIKNVHFKRMLFPATSGLIHEPYTSRSSPFVLSFLIFVCSSPLHHSNPSYHHPYE